MQRLQSSDITLSADPLDDRMETDLSEFEEFVRTASGALAAAASRGDYEMKDEPELKRKLPSCNQVLSEEARNEKYGCPARARQIEALKHSIELLSRTNRPTLITALGDEIRL
ncbi:hypothetical protein GUITHDRAFT_110426 [Guillardia theta CCMP2712]|uniref:Uncharacterized protein n=2 Tax=Guillardia theta TaxID=55529 RepID=L1J5K1_GUITC|nr:hypothetical protein GUITHDRAFT_110426 [Guillardia theta CCMP2712]EKX43627.1 hypothetical protein GUITHDRAFT_110426 [Guillardia theta CCMP2712]|eukprot:XP_005830607.1 hypothetical protein GUITHDRAFT_110426 [Guillardia theta CCMP2712]